MANPKIGRLGFLLSRPLIKLFCVILLATLRKLGGKTKLEKAECGLVNKLCVLLCFVVEEMGMVPCFVSLSCLR